MLTDAQYKALKALGDASTGDVSMTGSTLLTLVQMRLVHVGTQPACDEAIREYEEAQSKTKTHKGENNGIEN